MNIERVSVAFFKVLCQIVPVMCDTTDHNMIHMCIMRVILTLLILSLFMTANAIYENCSKLGKVFCFGAKDNQSFFDDEGCMTAKNCDAVIRGEKLTGYVIKWSLAGEKKEHMYKPVIELAITTDPQSLKPGSSLLNTRMPPGIPFMSGTPKSPAALVYINEQRVRHIATIEAAHTYTTLQWYSTTEGSSNQSFDVFEFSSTGVSYFRPPQDSSPKNSWRVDFSTDQVFFHLVHYHNYSDNGQTVLKTLLPNIGIHNRGIDIWRERAGVERRKPPPVVDPNFNPSNGSEPVDQVDPEVHEKKNKKNNLWIWILVGILLLLIVIAAIIFCVFYRKKKKKSKSKEKVQEMVSDSDPIVLFRRDNSEPTFNPHSHNSKHKSPSDHRPNHPHHTPTKSFSRASIATGVSGASGASKVSATAKMSGVSRLSTATGVSGKSNTSKAWVASSKTGTSSAANRSGVSGAAPPATHKKRTSSYSKSK